MDECMDYVCCQSLHDDHMCMLTAQSQMKWNSGNPVYLCGFSEDCGMIVAYLSDVEYLLKKVEERRTNGR